MEACSVGGSDEPAILEWPGQTRGGDRDRTQRTGRSALTDLAGYCDYCGKDANNLSHTIVIDSEGQTSQFIDNLNAGTSHFAVTAVCSKGLESPKCEIGSKTIL